MADTPSQNFGPLPDTLTFGPFGPDGDIIVHIENLVLGCPPFVQNIGVPFICEGEGYGSMTVFSEGAYCFWETEDADYFTLRSSDGTLTTYPSGEYALLNAGTYCFWASDADGELEGRFYSIEIESISEIHLEGVQHSGLSVSIGGYNGESISFTSVPNIGFLDVHDCPSLLSIDYSANVITELSATANPLLADVLVPVLSESSKFYFVDNALNVGTVDAIANCADPTIPSGVLTIVGDDTAVHSTASDDNIADLLTASWDVTLNT